ncbi:hypothetical protein PUNSTDRAFT_134480 [Punctularia strigosozonata HHB-11173 SS5]|uniref:uncharacterized protein n=1 Tax=Punctularia strigosozonata (strain HHB-11173) TaxID=741275 RepID=UPI00044170D3|nr:uncharacterized protein PUNSTDRAFT_134480 [Punctularia strigosozonata HHB-11173 SS5]EIN09327.1 hypothetical protein PUNSTDRAFT_134480 [Punctularia strigosozonata HHB-11173 SS5]
MLALLKYAVAIVVLLSAQLASSQADAAIQQCYKNAFAEALGPEITDPANRTVHLCEDISLFQQAANNIIRECFGGNINVTCVATAEQYIFDACFQVGVVIPAYNRAQVTPTPGSTSIFTTEPGMSVTSAVSTLSLTAPLPVTSNNTLRSSTTASELSTTTKAVPGSSVMKTTSTSASSAAPSSTQTSPAERVAAVKVTLSCFVTSAVVSLLSL